MSIRGPTLVLGGARSGKSAFAEQLVCDSGLPRVYVATATAGDEEMTQRIAHHRAQRDMNWQTIEEPLALVDILASENLSRSSVIVDCLTLWLSNLMHAGSNVDHESQRLADLLRTADRQIVLVSNEVGLGLVPETSLGRDFRDAQGRLNQKVGAAVANVAFVAAGFPIWLKRGMAE